MTRFVVILGMHRSGTSYVVQMLQNAGLFLGTDLLDKVAPDNLEGFGEARQVIEINDRILARSGGSYLQPPKQLVADKEEEAKMAAFLATLEETRPAGWKDPRTTLTLPLWKPLLGADYVLVGCIRHPMNVARSLLARQGLPLDEGLALWQAYNEKLLGYLEQEPRIALIDFDVSARELVERSKALCLWLGLSDQKMDELFNPFLRHHRELEAVSDPTIAALYTRLRELARKPLHNGGDAVEAKDAQPSEKKPKRSSRRLRQLARVVFLQNKSLQEVNGRLHGNLTEAIRRLELLERQSLVIPSTSARVDDLQNQMRLLSENFSLQLSTVSDNLSIQLKMAWDRLSEHSNYLTQQLTMLRSETTQLASQGDQRDAARASLADRIVSLEQQGADLLGQLTLMNGQFEVLKDRIAGIEAILPGRFLRTIKSFRGKAP